MPLTLAQIKQAVKTDTYTTNSNVFVAIPGLSIAITPSALTSGVWVMVSVACGADGSGNPIYFQLWRNGTPIDIGNVAGSRLQCSGGVGHHFAGNPSNLTINFIDMPNSVAPVTYQVAGCCPAPAGNLYINQTSTDTNSNLFGRSTSTITVIEVPA